MTAEQLAAQQQQQAGGLMAMAGLWSFVWLVVAILMIAGLWMVFVKAGEKGWKSLIPFYNTWVLWEIVGRPGWWFIWFFIPFVNIVMAVWLYYDLAKSFGHGTGWTIGMIVLPYIFVPMLGFGKSQYVGAWGKMVHGEATGRTPMTPTPA